MTQSVASIAVVSPVRLTATAQTPGGVTLAREDTQLTLSWDCVAGRHYRLFSTTTLGLSWQEVDAQPKPLLATTARLSCTVRLAPESRYYCVAEEDQFVWIPPGLSRWVARIQNRTGKPTKGRRRW
jgi:hypothetical protein